MTFNLPLLRTALIGVLLTAGSAMGHEGHDHGDAAKTSPAAALPRLEAVSGPFELVALLNRGDLLLYLDGFATNTPIVDATIAVETPSGSVTAETKGGTYLIAAPWATPGSHELVFTVSAGDQAEILAGTLVVPPDAATPGNGGHWTILSPFQVLGPEVTLGLGGIALVAAAAFLAGLIAPIILRRSTGRALGLSLLLLLGTRVDGSAQGPDHGDDKGRARSPGEIAQRLPDGALFVPKPVQHILAIRTTPVRASTFSRTIELPGRIIPDPNASGLVQAAVSGRLSPPAGGFPRLGTAVKAGDVLAYVTPPFQAIDASDMRQKAGELEQQISIVETRVARYEQLARTGAATKVTLDEAILELKGLRERRAALDKARAESERLIAPVSGMVAAANAVAGQIAETNVVVFQIVEPSRLWVEALTFSALPEARHATARTAEGRTLTLKFQGAGLSDRSQAIPVHFAIEGEERRLRVGQLVTVLAETGEEAKGLAVPRTSALRGANGQTIVFEHTGAERFEPRIVRVEALDAEQVLVLDGLTEGTRVVVQGAELLNQIR